MNLVFRTGPPIVLRMRLLQLYEPCGCQVL
ncbi:hypothetical protein glysoja_008096 [Glycine soja]|nr:hypothetical protein glysoja_008096 [Glycine soja]